MIIRRSARSLLLCLLPAAMAVATEADDWSGAPSEWVAGIDRAAFCGPGEWFFSVGGERVTESKARAIAVAELFFEDMYGHSAHWSSDAHVDELTALRIAREDDGSVSIQALAGAMVAATRNYRPKTETGLFRRDTGTTQCEPDGALTIVLWDDADDFGVTSVLKASLALAGDGALIARMEQYQCWLCINKNRRRDYVRFPAGITPSR